MSVHLMLINSMEKNGSLSLQWGEKNPPTSEEYNQIVTILTVIKIISY